MLAGLQRRALLIKRDIVALALAAHDPSVPWLAKLVAAVAVAYALSPIDLIPDFIPVIGYLDDLLILPPLIALSVWLIPAEVMQDLRVRAQRRQADRKSWLAAAVIVVIWITAAWLAARMTGFV